MTLMTATAAAIAHPTAEVARLTAENDRLTRENTLMCTMQDAVDVLAERREQTQQKIYKEAQQ